MKKKGFTLIELLAVIVILAIIALIATPIVMKVIENSKKGAAERSADNYLKEVETVVTAERMDGIVLEGEYTIQEDGNLCKAGETCTDETEIEISMSGNKPNGGTVLIENGKVVANLTGNAEKKTVVNISDYNVGFNADKTFSIIDKILVTSVTVNYDHCYTEAGKLSNGTFRKYLSGECTPQITIEPADATNKSLEFSILEETVKSCKDTLTLSNYLTMDKDSGKITVIKSHTRVEGETIFTVNVKAKDGSGISVDFPVHLQDGCMTCPVIIN